MPNIEEALPFRLNPQGFEEWYKNVKSPPQPASLRPLHAAIANRDNAPCKITIWGDSVAEGSTLSDWRSTFAYRLQEMLRGAFPTAGVRGGIGYLPSYFESPSLPATCSVDNSQQVIQTPAYTHNYIGGLGARGIELSYGGSIVFQYECTSFDVHYTKLQFGCSFEVYIDGSLVAGSSTNTASGSSATLGGFRWQSAELTPGMHTIRIRQIPIGGFEGFIALINGVMFYYGDKNKGIHVYNASKNGAAAQTGTTASFTSIHLASLTTIQPHCNMWQLATNDAVFYTNAATYQTNFGNLMTAESTAMSGLQWTRIPLLVSTPGGTLLDLWTNYVQAMKNVSNLYSNSLMVNMADWLGVSVAGDVLGLWNDGVHLSAKGHAMNADRLMHALGLNGGGQSRLGGNKLHVQLDFGLSGEDTYASTTVSDPFVQSASVITAALAGSTSDHDPEDGIIEGIVVGAGNIVPGVSYDVYGYAPEGTWGKYLVAAQY